MRICKNCSKELKKTQKSFCCAGCNRQYQKKYGTGWGSGNFSLGKPKNE